MTAVDHQVQVPSREELVARAGELRPLLTESAAAADRDRHLDPAVVDAVAAAGLFKLTVPRRLGGFQADMRTLLEVVAELGRGCMSTAWVTSVLNFSAWQAAIFGEPAQDDIWGNNPDARVCSVFGPARSAEEAGGGWTISGAWPAASGCAFSDFCALSVPVAIGPDGPVFKAFLVPLADMTIEDTWYSTGVRGSESNTVVAEDVRVPMHRVLELREALAGVRPQVRREDKLYLSSWSGVGATATLVPQLGLANAVLDLVMERSRDRRIPPAGIADQSEDAGFQMRVADAGAKIELAWHMARRVCDEVDAASATGELPDDMSRGRARMYSALASQYVYESVETMMSEAGSSALAQGQPLERMWRDMSTAHRHQAYRLDPARKVFGRILLGKGPGVNVRF